ncbi:MULTISPECIES: DUF1015 family protein [Streptomyces]|uniref:DUF1015 domain-containing protein n=2 Tax=Streptomyces TaxID=1883 RepID=A0A3M8F8F9_9ACTN|nr:MULTISPECIES: DUF1015 domain-containing protein [Streptomyces]KNE79356.1 SpoOJ or ParA or ParB or repB family protein [Streptomyces fradiae]OFA45507.1 chromosome partitioning protein ParA [Streptomyces fradiae]PQM20044.1 DUF1015 domain-containing protein [Streptomyces xinghaiensis]RKM96357.1 DUF1015 domain-containing protein [Streptomyces xinghaiensis]RNC74493.1 DUF1015 domain-containing protein [Streptomyces xinghaiensis]
MSRTGLTRDGLRLSPFRGLRYAPERVGSLAAVTSPPYDVVVRPDGLRHLETADPYNIVRLILPHGADPAVCHRQAGETLRRWRAEGVLRADPEPALYVYEQYGEGLLQRGLIGALRLSPPEEGVVLPHEDVMPDVVADRAALMRATAANLEPLLLTYRGDAAEDGDDYGDAGGDGPRGAAAVIERAVRGAPLLTTVTEDDRRHRLWAVTDPAELAEADADLSRRRALIADGHHRWATYLRLREEQPSPGPWDSGLVLLVDTARHPLRVRAIHRLLPRLPLPEALDALRGAFRVRRVDGPLPHALKALGDPAEPTERGAGTTGGDGDGAMAGVSVGPGTAGNAFLLAGDDGSFHLVDRPDAALLARTVPAGRPRAWRTLDATVLHSVLLGRIWEVPDDPEHIRYIHDAAAAVEQVERHGGTAVLMRPVREETVRHLAEQGVMMPRKSTSFGPKPATGLVLRSLGGD